MNEVRVGQVWADNDKRSAGRHVKIVSIDRDGKATVCRCTAAGGALDERTTRIRLDRFKPNNTGYRLVLDA